MAKRTNWKRKYEALQAEYTEYRHGIANTDPHLMTVYAWSKAHEKVMDHRNAVQDAIRSALKKISQGNLPGALTDLHDALKLKPK